MNYEEDIHIDSDLLDVEWLDQPALLMRYARNAAQARMALDKAKEALELARAEIDKKIRTIPEKYGIEKVTEGAVQAAILTQTAFKEATDTFIQAKFDADIAQGAVNAVNQRKDALENLVRLHGMQYFAGPKVPHDLTQLKKERDERLNADMMARVTRTRRSV